MRSADDVIYANELADEAVLTYTRESPDGWTGHTGRIDARLLAEPGADAELAFLCGSNGFVEAASEFLLDLGLSPARIRTERFGPTS